MFGTNALLGTISVMRYFEKEVTIKLSVTSWRLRNIFQIIGDLPNVNECTTVR